MTVAPCKACVKQYGVKDINSVNECCFNTCASFVGNDQQDVLDSECGKSCMNCMYNMIVANGRNPCEFWPEVPTIKNDPRPFYCCREEKDPYKCCVERCRGDTFPHECRLNCKLASESVIKDVREEYTATLAPKTYGKIIALILVVLVCLFLLISYLIKIRK